MTQSAQSATRCAGSETAIDVVDEAWHDLFVNNAEPRQPCPSCGAWVVPYPDAGVVRLRAHLRAVA